jgi:hypothetical protein
MTRKARTRLSPVQHARYLAWAGRACSIANRGKVVPVLNRWSFDLHLYEWAIEAGFLDPPDELTRPYSVYVADVFSRMPDTVKEQARRYWRQRAKALQHDPS